MLIKIFSIGKTKESWLDEGIEEYVKRLKPHAKIEFYWAKNDQQLISWLNQERNVVILDIQGESLSSEQFAVFLEKKLEQGGSRLNFAIGGAEGFPKDLRSLYYAISLSRMTFTHQLARLLLLEQIYRGFQILRGSPYHK